MRTNKLEVALRAAAGTLLVSTLLAGCAKPAPDPKAAPPPAEALPAPDASPAAPAQPAPDAPPPTERAAIEPSLDSMTLAPPSAKLGVPVDLRYQFDGATLPNQPVTLHLAAVPRVPGARVNVIVKQVDGVQVAAGPLSLQKTHAADMYRQQLSVTRGAESPSQLRVLVTMELAEGSAFGFYSIPLDGGTNAQKQDSVKQR